MVEFSLLFGTRFSARAQLVTVYNEAKLASFGGCEHVYPPNARFATTSLVMPAS